jgi:flagellar hook-associated protein FlgK
VASGQYLVQGNKGSTLGIERNATNPDKAVLMLDPYMSPQAVTQVVGGSIAGISEFRQNSLTILRDELDTLTQVFVGQVNNTHALGIDAQGNFGGDLFSVGNIYAVTPGLNKGTGFVTVSALPNAKIERLTMDLTYSDSKKLWTLTDTTSKKAVTGVTELTMGGVKVTLSGVPKDADTFSLTSTKRPIDAMQVSVTEHSNIAAGGAVSVTSASTNTSGTRMILNGYVKPTAAVVDTTMDTALRNNIAQVAASDLSASNTLAFVIPANTQDSQFYSTEQNGSSNTQMQVFTRAGKQLYGSALSSSEQTALVTSGNGFSSNAAYDSTYSNQTGSNAYMDANVTVTNPTSGDARDYFALAGSLKEDLLVFVTGTGSAEVSGQWGSLATVDVREQLRQNIDVQFAADASTYVLTDTTTNTKLTSGTFTAGSTIEHNGWTVSFDGVIQANDKFSVRGNSAQAGDNRNLLKIIDLQGNKDIFSGRGDFTEVYTDVIGDLGYSVVQSAVSRDAQQIIFDQAQAKRDETSAVSLDEEAANLLRFQQAYQASAQVISTATKLFDTILGIR